MDGTTDPSNGTPDDDRDEAAVVSSACEAARERLGAAVCSVWELLDDGAVLVGTAPAGPPAGTLVRLDGLGEVAGSVRRGEVALVRADDPAADPAERAQLEAGGYVGALRVPFSVSSGDRHFLAVSWASWPSGVDTAELTASARALAEQLTAGLRRVRELELGWQRALELHDDVAQDLAAVVAALELGEEVELLPALRRALDGAQRVMGLLTAQTPPGWHELRRGSVAPVRPVREVVEPEDFVGRSAWGPAVFVEPGRAQAPAPAAASTDGHGTAPAARPAEAVTRTVLLVDDTDDLRSLIRRAIQRHQPSWEVLEAGDGVEAVEVATTRRFDAVLLDLAMPRRSGLEALPDLRAAQPDARIVVLSGFADDVTIGRARALGADGYLAKGAELAEIVTALAAGRDGVSPAVPG